MTIDRTSPNPGGQRWHASFAWLGDDRLTPNVYIEVRNGVITQLSSGPAPRGAIQVDGIVVPGLVNGHSHAFHRLLRGRTHRQGGDFWLWRERMYEIAASLTPETYERLATAVFVEMAMAGVTTVGEFHYLHHQPDGVPYDDPNEMGHALARAAHRAGIRIALLDTGYLTAGFDDRPLDPVQQRFSDGTPGAWLERADALRETYADSDDVVVGIAPHSVRAVSEKGLVEVARRYGDELPVHIHVSEQPGENRECLAATTLTPTGLLDRVGLLRPGTTLIHATHLTDADIESIGDSGAMVCYCATTERDLGDGMGPGSRLLDAGTSLSVGSDSHAVIDIFEEIRGIEMHARLAAGTRGVVAPPDLLSAGTTNGAESLGFPSGHLTEGTPADFVVIDTRSPRLAGLGTDSGLDTLVFAATAADVKEVFVGGRRIVNDHEHPLWEEAWETLEDFGH